MREVAPRNHSRSRRAVQHGSPRENTAEWKFRRNCFREIHLQWTQRQMKVRSVEAADTEAHSANGDNTTAPGSSLVECHITIHVERMLSPFQFRMTVEYSLPRRFDSRKETLNQPRIEVRELNVRVVKREGVGNQQTDVAAKM